MTLIWNLLMGGRMGRCMGSPDTLMFDQRIDLRGFSAGSFAGLSTLHLLWKIPNVVTNGKLGAIACPPQLIVTPPNDHTLHLLHYEADQLCVWKPGEHQLEQLCENIQVPLRSYIGISQTQNNERQNTTDTHKTNPQATH